MVGWLDGWLCGWMVRYMVGWMDDWMGGPQVQHVPSSIVNETVADKSVAFHLFPRLPAPYASDCNSNI